MVRVEDWTGSDGPAGPSGCSAPLHLREAHGALKCWVPRFRSGGDSRSGRQIPGMPAPRFYRRRLPHWRVDGATYFVTWRLHRRQPRLSPDERSVVLLTLRRFEAVKFVTQGMVVMDDHIHVVTTPMPDQSLEGVIQGWKAFSARSLRQNGRRAPVWQRGYFDTIVRGQSALERTLAYIRWNPQRRWPSIGAYPWLYLP